MVTRGFRQEAEAHWTLDLEASGGVVNLGRQALRLPVVLDAESNLIGVLCCKNSVV